MVTAATPGRDELREQIAAALLHRRFGPNRDLDPQQARLDAWDDATVAASVVDTWVAAHTAEMEDEVTALWAEVGAKDEQVAALTAALAEAQGFLDSYDRRWRQTHADNRDLRAAVARVRALCDTYEGPNGSHYIHPSVVRAALDPPTEGQ